MLTDCAALRPDARVAVTTTAEYFIPRILAGFASASQVDVSLQIHNRRALIARMANNEDELYLFANRPRIAKSYGSDSSEPMSFRPRRRPARARTAHPAFAPCARAVSHARTGSGTRMVAEQFSRARACSDRAHGVVNQRAINRVSWPDSAYHPGAPCLRTRYRAESVGDLGRRGFPVSGTGISCTRSAAVVAGRDVVHGSRGTDVLAGFSYPHHRGSRTVDCGDCATLSGNPSTATSAIHRARRLLSHRGHQGNGD